MEAEKAFMKKTKKKVMICVCVAAGCILLSSVDDPSSDAYTFGGTIQVPIPGNIQEDDLDEFIEEMLSWDASRNGYEADPDSETVIRNLEQLSYVIGAAVIKKPEDKGINKKQPKIRR